MQYNTEALEKLLPRRNRSRRMPHTTRLTSQCHHVSVVPALHNSNLPDLLDCRCQSLLSFTIFQSCSVCCNHNSRAAIMVAKVYVFRILLIFRAIRMARILRSFRLQLNLMIPIFRHKFHNLLSSSLKGSGQHC